MKVFQLPVDKAQPRVEEMDLLAIHMYEAQENFDGKITKENTDWLFYLL